MTLQKLITVYSSLYPCLQWTEPMELRTGRTVSAVTPILYRRDAFKEDFCDPNDRYRTRKTLKNVPCPYRVGFELTDILPLFDSCVSQKMRGCRWKRTKWIFYRSDRWWSWSSRRVRFPRIGSWRSQWSRSSCPVSALPPNSCVKLTDAPTRAACDGHRSPPSPGSRILQKEKHTLYREQIILLLEAE